MTITEFNCQGIMYDVVPPLELDVVMTQVVQDNMPVKGTESYSIHDSTFNLEEEHVSLELLKIHVMHSMSLLYETYVLTEQVFLTAVGVYFRDLYRSRCHPRK